MANVTAGTSYEYGYKSILTFVVIFGILGNILVVLSMLRQRRLLKNNFYCLVFHVTACDLSYLLLSTYKVYVTLAGKKLDYSSQSVCILFVYFRELCLIFGAYFMLVISIIRYRAVLHPLKPSISSRLFKVVFCFVYISSIFISGPNLYCCLVPSSSFLQTNGLMLQSSRAVIWYCLPVTIMSVIYWKICRELIRQNNAIKSTNSTPKMTPSNYGKLTRLLHHRNWRTFLVSFTTVVCFAVAGLPKHVIYFLYTADSSSVTVHFLRLVKYSWLIQAAGTCAINPLIYGILDKKLLSFLKIFRTKKIG